MQTLLSLPSNAANGQQIVALVKAPPALATGSVGAGILAAILVLMVANADAFGQSPSASDIFRMGARWRLASSQPAFRCGFGHLHVPKRESSLRRCRRSPHRFSIEGSSALTADSDEDLVQVPKKLAIGGELLVASADQP